MSGLQFISAFSLLFQRTLVPRAQLQENTFGSASVFCAIFYLFIYLFIHLFIYLHYYSNVQQVIHLNYS